MDATSTDVTARQDFGHRGQGSNFCGRDDNAKEEFFLDEFTPWTDSDYDPPLSLPDKRILQHDVNLEGRMCHQSLASGQLLSARHRTTFLFMTNSISVIAILITLKPIVYLAAAW